MTNIMIDYDHTFTADPLLWSDFMCDAVEAGHKVYVVTSRDENDPLEDTDWFVAAGFPVVYCDYHAKRRVCEERGLDIHIWIDDRPYYIDHNYPEVEANNWRNNAN